MLSSLCNLRFWIDKIIHQLADIHRQPTNEWTTLLCFELKERVFRREQDEIHWLLDSVF